MNGREEKMRKLREAAQQSKQKADELLEAELLALKKATQTDIDALRPKVTNRETFERLLKAVQESTVQNETLAQLKGRLEKAGDDIIHIAKEASKLLKPV